MIYEYSKFLKAKKRQNSAKTSQKPVKTGYKIIKMGRKCRKNKKAKFLKIGPLLSFDHLVIMAKIIP
jgi:hypothetical protein